MPCYAIGHQVIYRKCYGFKRASFTLTHFLLYTPSCFSRLPWGCQFNLKDSRVLCCDSKHSFNPTICLNNKVFSIRYYSIGSFYVLRPASEHYINLLLILNPLFNSFISCEPHVLSTRPQKLLVSYDL